MRSSASVKIKHSLQVVFEDYADMKKSMSSPAKKPEEMKNGLREGTEATQNTLPIWLESIKN